VDSIKLDLDHKAQTISLIFSIITLTSAFKKITKKLCH